ncbi:MAG: hypothetical protein C3F06_01585 [Candidatus Methanoperedenaceae archaeon]|nr:MAG: hypothetical protein C3F06_01585 [Candidatus Methanoperedenaceae archaeon]
MTFIYFLSTRQSFKSAVFIDNWAIAIILCITKACDLGLGWFMILGVKHAPCIFIMLASHVIPPWYFISGVSIKLIYSNVSRIFKKEKLKKGTADKRK